jgi:hypothetical protein
MIDLLRSEQVYASATAPGNSPDPMNARALRRRFVERTGQKVNFQAVSNDDIGDRVRRKCSPCASWIMKAPEYDRKKAEQKKLLLNVGNRDSLSK